MLKVNKIKEVPHCQLGEGLWWDAKDSILWFVDINSFILYRLNTYNKKLTSWNFQEEISWIIPTEKNSKILIGCSSGVLLFDLNKPEKREWYISTFPNDINLRLNDVGIDSLGRIWFGSIHKNNESLAVGKLVSYSNNTGLIVHDKGYKITNGPIISHDGKFLYHNDSAKRIVYRYNLNLDKGILSNRIIFRKFNEYEGSPDGMCFDERGNILIAMWGSGNIQHIDTNGNTLNLYNIPVPNVTNVCFGGEKFDKLYVTTARKGLSNEDLQRYPESGALFEIIGLEFAGALPNIQRIIL
jgi:xylono-1,5-lactonase